MNDTDIGDSFEWENEFMEWVRNKKSDVDTKSMEIQDIPEIKKFYSENFILQNFLDEN